MLLKKTNTIFSIVAGLALCLLVGCGGGGGGSTTSSGTPDRTIAHQPKVESPQNPIEGANPLDDIPPTTTKVPGEPDNIPSTPPSNTVTEIGLFNDAKFSLVNVQQAWDYSEGEFPNKQKGKYRGEEVIVGIMEEVNPFNRQIYKITRDSIHPNSIFTSPYPADLPPPPDKYIANNVDELVANDKRLLDPGFSRQKKYPPVPCMLQFDSVDDCPDKTGGTKYFLRLEGGGLGVLPSFENLNPDEHECPMFDLEEGEEPQEICPQFSIGHGTGVAGVAAAKSRTRTLTYNNESHGPSRFRGIAYNAEILVYARPLEIAGLPASIKKHADYFRNAPTDAHVYNFSHTFSRPVTGIDSAFRNVIRESGFAEIATAIGDMKQPLIAATGNDGKAFPLFPAALPLFFPNLRGKILAVTATNDQGVITSYANRCGILSPDWDTNTNGRHYCLAAPGGDKDSPFLLAGPDKYQYSFNAGTSFATPVVAGAFAILKQRFRNRDDTYSLSDEQLIIRLVNTANNAGHYSDMSIYGAGMLDIGAAVKQVGTLSMSILGDITEGITYEFDLTSLTTSAAFGDALQRAFQTREVAAFDELNAPFWYPLSSLTPTTSSRETLRERRARLFEQDIAPVVETAIGGKLALTSTHAGSSGQIDMSLRQPVDILVPQAELLLTAGDLSTAPFGLHDDKSFAHPYLHFADEGIGLGGALQLGKGQLTAMGFTSSSANVARDIPINAHGGILEYALEPLTGIEFGMQAGALMEESRALGLLSEGGFGDLGESSTAFAGISLDSELEDSWRFRASMLFGRTNLDEPSIGLLKTSTSLTSSAFRFAVEGSDVFLDADRMDVFVAQPLRIENGKANFTVPVGRTPSGLVRREQINGVSLEPGGRELEFGARYEMEVREDITATGGIGIVHEGGHSKQTETELYGLANLRFQF